MKGYGGQYDLARRVPDLETRDDVSGFIRRIDEPLQQMLLGAQSGSEEVRFTYEGRPPGKAKSGASLTALEEFTKVLRAFWIREVSDTFGFNQTRVFDETTDAHKGRREAASPAARLLVGAAKILDPRYNLGSVKHALGIAYKKPEQI